MLKIKSCIPSHLQNLALRGISGLILIFSTLLAFNQEVIVTDTIIRLPAQLPDTNNRITQQPDTLTTGSVSDTLEIQNKKDDRERRSIQLPANPVPDSLGRSAIPWYTEQQLQDPYKLNPNFIDTTLTGFQNYDFALDNGLFMAVKGNPGHTHRNLHYKPDLSSEVNIGDNDLYGAYLLSHESIRYYRPKHVFTELFYITGGDREQLFYARHNQKFSENFFAGLNYRIISSPGTYSNVASSGNSLSLSADYLSSDQRYQILGSFIFNNLRNQESGGLRNHTSFEQDPVRDSVFLYQAESWIRDISINLRHFYQTGFYWASDTSQPERFINFGRINHDFTYQRTAFLLDDPSTPYPFYDHPRLDSISTYDSTAVHKVLNRVSWSNFPLTSGRGSFPFNFKVFAQHTLLTIRQPDERPLGKPRLTDDKELIYYSKRENFTSLQLGAEIMSDDSKLLSFGGYANSTLGGYNDEDAHLGGYLNFGKQGSPFHLKARMDYASQEAPYFLNTLSVNNVQWNNNFDKMQILRMGAVLNIPTLRIEADYYLLDHYVYLGRDALPVQNSAEVNFLSLGLYNDFEWGILGMRNHVLFQQPTTYNFDRLPTIISYHSLYIKSSFFQQALVNQMGIDFHFNTGYKAMSYMPVVRGFYLQDEYRMREKYLVDVYWNAKISNARLFIKYQNLLGLIFDIPPHYDIPFYPIPESMFKFGVSWMFYN